MKRFRLSLAMSILACLAFATGLGYGIADGWPVLALAALSIATIVMVLAIWSLSKAIMSQTRTFVKSLEMNDFTLKFPAVKDSEVNEIHDAMNRIIALYRDGTNALETRKLYYDRILRIMTHELRNCITPIVSLSNDMRRHPERYRGENLDEALSVIASESHGIKHFLDSYYELTHLPKPKIERVDAAGFFAQIQKTFSIKVKEAGFEPEIVTYTVAAGLELDIDPGMMRHVIDNLLSNALYAVGKTRQPSISIIASLPEGHPYITVSDNGCGMSPQTLDSLFQPFFTTKPDGNGIGLCLSRQIVGLHKGNIRVSSTVGRGSSFHISLP